MTQDENPVAGPSGYSPPTEWIKQEPNSAADSSSYTTTPHGYYAQQRIAQNAEAGYRLNPLSRRKLHQQRRTLPKEATKILEQWLVEHCFKPFPDEKEKRRLVAVTKLTETQVSNWFINARRRQLRGILAKYGISVETVLKRKASKVKKTDQQDENSKSRKEQCSRIQSCYCNKCFSAKVTEMTHDMKSHRGYKLFLLYAIGVTTNNRDLQESKRNMG